MSANTPVDIAGLITSDSGVQGGKLCLAGTRIRVHTIAAMAMQGMDAEHILQEFPHLDLARIHAALAYYHANKATIEVELEAERKLGGEFAAMYPHGWTRETDRA